mgnify:CR=1 FL=1
MKTAFKLPPGLYFDPLFLTLEERTEIVQWLETLHPIWEQRYSKHNPPPPGESQRWLLRPVYWLGNWQFACLNYYHPPKGTEFRCVKAEPYPAVLQRVVKKMENLAVQSFPRDFIPAGWKLNTCLVNMYGSQLNDGKKEDTARVGEHKDFEPGPVASLSLGERAIFQFVSSSSRDHKAKVVEQQWLTDGSLQMFAGRRWKDELFHRVQRVDTIQGYQFKIQVENFEVRRVNFTFRYVPEKHIYPLKALPKEKVEDIRPYLEILARNSSYYRSLLNQ